MSLKTLKPSAFFPTAPRTGSERVTLFRGKNVWIRGKDEFYAECYQGSENLSETIPTQALTGTISFAAGSKNVTGTATQFIAELHQGQFLLSGGEMLVVDRIFSNLLFTVTRAPGSTASAQAASRLPVLFELDKKRGTLLRGNAVEFEQGSMIAVGDGVLRVNGQILAGDSLTASRQPKIARYNAGTNNYSVNLLGLSEPSGITATNVAGGTRGMTAGKRGIRICRARTATGNGYGNPSENLIVDLAANQKIRLQNLFSEMDEENGQNAWLVYTTIYKSTSSLNQAEGPWFRNILITKDQILFDGAEDYVFPNGYFDFEFLNSEINGEELLSFNNDPPCDAEFVQALTGYPIYISCQGQGNPDAPDGTSPGPFIVPAKPNNIEAAPLAYPNPVATSPPENILGAFTASGRLFLMTANRLLFAAFTGSPVFPVTIRPYFRRGFAGPYNACVIDENIFAATSGGFTRSIAESDGSLEQYDFAADIKELSLQMNLGHTLVGHDPKNEAACFFYSGAYKNTAGFWVTVVYPFMLGLGFWNPPIVLESDTQDMIVSGVATINGKLEFLAGGRTAEGGVRIDTYRFDSGANQAVKWYLAWSFSDEGSEQSAKVIKGFRLTGKTTGATFGIHGARSGESIDAAALEAGNAGSCTGAISIGNKSHMTLNEWQKFVVRELLLYTVRVDGTWDGSGEKDRIDEICLNVEISGLRK